MSQINTINNVLNEFRSESVKSVLESLLILLKELEEKNDPEPVEIEIVSITYQFLEKLNLLENSLRTYKKSESILTGNKLYDLRKKLSISNNFL